MLYLKNNYILLILILGFFKVQYVKSSCTEYELKI